MHVKQSYGNGNGTKHVNGIKHGYGITHVLYHYQVFHRINTR